VTFPASEAVWTFAGLVENAGTAPVTIRSDGVATYSLAPNNAAMVLADGTRWVVYPAGTRTELD
jgi:hypothetical protein